jgi:hypothetical protein
MWTQESSKSDLGVKCYEVLKVNDQISWMWLVIYDMVLGESVRLCGHPIHPGIYFV